MLILSSLIACSAFSLSKDNAPSGAAFDTANSTATTTGDQADPEPAWFVVRGTLEVTEEGPKAQAGALFLDVVGDDLETTLCEVELKTNSLAAGTVETDAAIGAWWTLTVEAKSQSCATLPGSLGLGLGELQPDVAARLGAVGMEDRMETLYGAFIQVDGGEISTFGYSGTDGNLDGSAEAVLPPVAGIYEVVPLYLLMLPG